MGVMTLPLSPGAPQACQGHHRLIRGTTDLAGAPQASQGAHKRPSRGTTGLPRAPVRTQSTAKGLSGPQRAPVHHRPLGGTTDLPRAPVRQSEHCRMLVGPQKGTTGLPGGTNQRHHNPHAKHGIPQRPIRSTTGLSGAPQGFQGHHRLVRGTTGLSEALLAFQGNLLLCLLSRNHCDRLLF